MGVVMGVVIVRCLYLFAHLFAHHPFDACGCVVQGAVIAQHGASDGG